MGYNSLISVIVLRLPDLCRQEREPTVRVKTYVH